MRLRFLLDCLLIALCTTTLAAQAPKWIDRTPSSPLMSPSPRSGHAMAYDASRAEVILFGGVRGGSINNAFNETWLWNGMTWINRSPVNSSDSPPGRYNTAMAYDSLRGRVVLFYWSTEVFTPAIKSADVVWLLRESTCWRILDPHQFLTAHNSCRRCVWNAETEH